MKPPVHRRRAYFPIAYCGATAREGAKMTIRNKQATCPACLAVIAANQQAAKVRAAVVLGAP